MMNQLRRVAKMMTTLLVQSLFLTFAMTYGQTSKPSQHPDAPLSLTLNASVAKAKAGVPVEVIVRVTNTSNHTISLWKENAVDQGGSVYRVGAYDEKGSPVADTKTGRAFKGLDSPGPVTSDIPESSSGGWVVLKPGEVQVDKVNVSRLYDLSRPGNYVIQCRRFDEETKSFVESNKITVTVTP